MSCLFTVPVLSLCCFSGISSLDARPGTVRKVMGIAKPGTLSQYPELVDSLAHEGHNRIAALDLEGTAAVHCFREKALETSLRYFPS